MIYFIWDSGGNFIKIGVSDEPETRLRELQTANPNPLFLLAVTDGDYSTETALHTRFSDLRVHGSSEWFKASAKLLWFIRRTAWRGKDALSGYSSPTPRATAAVAFLEERFRERREWQSEEIKSLATQAGISKNALFSAEAQELPIRKRKRVLDDGSCVWVWIANEEWPGVTSIQVSNAN